MKVRKVLSFAAIALAICVSVPHRVKAGGATPTTTSSVRGIVHFEGKVPAAKPISRSAKTSATNSAAFQLALWEVTFENALNPLNVDGASLNKGTTYATGPDGPGTVIAIANLAMATGNIGREGVGVNPLRASGSHRVPPRSRAGHLGDARGRSRHAGLRDAPAAEGLAGC